MTFTVPYEPFGKQRPRFMRSGHAYTPKKTHDYEKLVRQFYRGELYECPIKVAILATHGMAESYSKKKRAQLDGQPWTGKPDADNIAKAVLDALNGVAYADDKQITGLSVVKRYGTTGSVQITIEEDTQ